MARKTGKNNFQDKFSENEYAKGERAGEAKASNSKQRDNKRRTSKHNNRDRSSSSREGNSSSKSDRIISNGNKTNDISWHKPNENMFNDVTGITINAAVGAPLVERDTLLIPSGVDGSTWYWDPQINPGIMVASFAPTLGASEDSQSPVNKGMTKLFQFLRKDKSGREIYQPADIGMTIGALDSCYMYYAFCCKIYGMSRNVDIMNDYTPEYLVRAHGVSWESVNSNRANFKFWIDQFANDLSGFYVPKGLHLIDRHTYMTEKIFTDSETTKAQIYSFLPIGYWKFVEGTEAAPFSTLSFQTLINTETMNAKEENLSNLLSVEQLINFGNSLIQPLQDSEAVRNITADMLTAFSANGSYSVGFISNDYTVVPKFDKKVLMALENATFYGPSTGFAGKYSQIVSVNESYITSDFSFTPGSPTSTSYPPEFSTSPAAWDQFYPNKAILNFHWDDVTRDDIMYASRFAGCGFSQPVDEDGTGLDAMRFKTIGSEVMCDFTITYLARTKLTDKFGPLKGYIWRTQTYQFLQISTTSSPVAPLTVYSRILPVLRMQAELTKFDWHPKWSLIPYAHQAASGTSQLTILDYQYDMDVFGIVTEEALAQMNMVSLLGLFKIEEMKSYSY